MCNYHDSLKSVLFVFYCFKYDVNTCTLHENGLYTNPSTHVVRKALNKIEPPLKM